jgi:hypothetical protein
LELARLIVVDDLADPDVCLEQLGMARHGDQAEQRAPRVSEKINARLPEAISENTDQLEGVGELI